MFLSTWNMDVYIKANKLNNEVRYNNNLYHATNANHKRYQHLLSDLDSALRSVTFGYDNVIVGKCNLTNRTYNSIKFPYKISDYDLYDFDGRLPAVQISNVTYNPYANREFANDNHEFVYALSLASEHLPEELLAKPHSVSSRRDQLLLTLSYIKFHLFKLSKCVGYSHCLKKFTPIQMLLTN